MQNSGMNLLRRHDYYKGWLDSMITVAQRYAYVEGLLNEDVSQLLLSSSNPRRSCSAGVNVDLLFGWSALCQEYGNVDYDFRLDDRKWSLADLNPHTEGCKETQPVFWAGVQFGIDEARGSFVERFGVALKQ